MFGQITCPALSSSSPVRPPSFFLIAKWLYADAGSWHLLFSQSYIKSDGRGGVSSEGFPLAPLHHLRERFPNISACTDNCQLSDIPVTSSVPLLKVQSGSVKRGCMGWTWLVPHDPGSAAWLALTCINQPPPAMAFHAPCPLTCPAVIRGLCWYVALIIRQQHLLCRKKIKLNRSLACSCITLHCAANNQNLGVGESPFSLLGGVRL